MSENSNEKINFVLNVLRDFSIEEERNVFNCNKNDNKRSQLSLDISESTEDLQDPFCAENEETTKIKLV
jgi:50S ribosomal subunit-associated GTPase HflX